jgi:probable F420-dependent oxidoreductase
MHLGVFGMGTTARVDPAVMVEIGQLAEELGYESLWVGEHVVLPEPRTPASPLAASTPMHDPLVALTFLAARTERVRLGTGILILPQRNPAVLAKELASLDVLSRGRLTFGIGVGGLAEEFAAVGVPLSARGRRADEYLDAMRTLWEMDVPVYEGTFAHIAAVDAHPRPVQRPLPVVVGGHSPAALRRAVERGQGWYGFGLEVDAAAALLAELRAAERRYERPAALGPLEITLTPPLRSTEQAAYADLGADRLVMVPSNSLDRDGLRRWLEERAPR